MAEAIPLRTGEVAEELTVKGRDGMKEEGMKREEGMEEEEGRDIEKKEAKK